MPSASKYAPLVHAAASLAGSARTRRRPARKARRFANRQRQIAGAHGGGARNRTQRVNRLLIERPDRRRRIASSSGSETVARTAARDGTRHRSAPADEAANQEAGADRQHERKRELSDDERSEQPALPAARCQASTALLQRTGVRAPRGAKGRPRRRRRSGVMTARPARRARSGVESDRLGGAEACRRRAISSPRISRIGQRQPGGAAGRSEHERLGEQLAHDAPRRRAERGGECQFALAATAERVSMRLATSAHPMSSTRPTAPIRRDQSDGCPPTVSSYIGDIGIARRRRTGRMGAG